MFFFIFALFFFMNIKRYFSVIYGRFIYYHFRFDNLIFSRSTKFIFKPSHIHFFNPFFFIDSFTIFSPFFENFFIYFSGNCNIKLLHYIQPHFSFSIKFRNFFTYYNNTQIYYWNLNNRSFLLFLSGLGGCWG
jgi:hypothetical protein